MLTTRTSPGTQTSASPKTPIPVEAALAGRRVLVVNAIRSDTPSGGNTSTQGMLRRWRTLCTLQELALNPSPARSGAKSTPWGFMIASMPAPLLVLWARRSGHVWLEFFLRLSPLLFLRCLWWRSRFKPEVVIFNHHAAFPYAWAFPGCERVLVWHDVPSLKRDGTRATRVGARRCAALERLFLGTARYCITFSFDDERLLRRLHGWRSTVVPVIANEPRARAAAVNPRGWLLIGNWGREENSEGAASFLCAYGALCANGTPGLADAQFHVAGHGAVAFVDRLRRSHPEVDALPLRATDRYADMRDFDEVALLAPLLRGAGIKLKTIEAWSCGIPVIGTAQAFSGLPALISRQGGLRVASPQEMARRFLDPAALRQACDRLDPMSAFAQYHDAIRRTASDHDSVVSDAFESHAEGMR